MGRTTETKFTTLILACMIPCVLGPKEPFLQNPGIRSREENHSVLQTLKTGFAILPWSHRLEGRHMEKSSRGRTLKNLLVQFLVVLEGDQI